jgi:hypothetical protein
MGSLYVAKNGQWVLAGQGGGAPSDSEKHKYDPEEVVPLSSPTIFTPSTAGSLGTLGSTTDFICIVDGNLNNSTNSNMLSITGGRNGWFLGKNGGKLTETRTTTSQKNGILRQNAYGHTFIDSLHIDSTSGMSVDNIVIRGYAPYGTSRVGWTYPKTYIQNCRIDGSQYTGNFADPHPDIFQKQTALGSVYFYNFTSSFIYQGFLIACQSFSLSNGSTQEQWVEGLKDGNSSTDGELRIEKTNIYRRGSNYYGPALWIGWNTQEGNSGFPGDDNFPVYFDGEDNWVYGNTTAADTMASGGGLVYPTGLGFFDGSHAWSGTAINSAISSDATSSYATWVAAADINGKLREGLRPGGDHVTAGSLVGYDSPFLP